MSDALLNQFVQGGVRNVQSMVPHLVRVPPGQLSNSTGTLYTAPSTAIPTGAVSRATLYSITLVNTDTASHTATIYLVESGGSAADNRVICKDEPLTAKQRLIIQWDKGIALGSGETIQGVADAASKVTYRLSVEES